MEIIELKRLPKTYKNNGQHAEQVVKYTFTGKVYKADNTPFWIDADFMDIQIKSARATVCNTTDINNHLSHDKANRYGYVIKDFSKMVIMNKQEYLNFVLEFGSIERASQKNGGNLKIRLKSESKVMLEWLGLL